MDSKLLNSFRITSTCNFAICTLLIIIQAASAQSLLDWFSGNEDTVSDRRLVGFDPDYSPNQIIVSFGDRRLYHIVQRGQAISYPIALITTLTQIAAIGINRRLFANAVVDCEAKLVASSASRFSLR